MNLTPNRRKLLMICACIVVGMLMYPPLQFRGIGRGYGWIFSPDDGLAVNASQLLVQWLGVAIVGVIAYVVLGDRQSGPPGEGDPGGTPFLSKELGTSAVIPVLRLVRACVAVVGWWQVVGIVAGVATVSVALHADGLDAIEGVGGYLAQVSLKAIVAAICIWAAAVLRSLINALHMRWNGAPHPALVKRWNL